MTTVYISFDGEINQNTIEQLKGVVFNQISNGATHLYFLFSTPGGFVAEGMSLYNLLKGLPVEITMHNVGNVDSIGNAIFLAGKHRYACTHSTFMFHGVGIMPVNGVRLEEKNLRENLSSIQADQRRIGSIISEQPTLKSVEINRLFREARTKDSAFALVKGIIQEIREVSIPSGAPVIQLVFQR